MWILTTDEHRLRGSNKTRTVIPSAAEESVEIVPRSDSLFCKPSFVRVPKTDFADLLLLRYGGVGEN